MWCIETENQSVKPECVVRTRIWCVLLPRPSTGWCLLCFSTRADVQSLLIATTTRHQPTMTLDETILVIKTNLFKVFVFVHLHEIDLVAQQTTNATEASAKL